MATLEVLCQNGRREKVKVQPSTPLLEVIDEVCKKQGLDPGKHRVTHNKKQLDSTLQYRYSGLLNNAKLDLVEATGTEAQMKVALALQLPEGERLVDNFLVETTLFDVLAHFQTLKGLSLTAPQTISGAVQQPICVYAQTEVVGVSELKATSLRNLGLTGGRAGLRFIWKEVSAEKLGEIERALTARKEKAQKLERRSQMLAAAATAQQTTPMDLSDQTQVLQASISDPTPATSDFRFRTVFDDGPAVSAFGSNSRERSMFDPEPAPVAPPVRVQSMFTSERKPQPPGQFSAFKFPEETKGQDLYKNEMTVKNVNELTKACDREAVLYDSAEAKAAHEEGEELPDDFYEVTKEDLQLMHKDLVRQTAFTVSSRAALRYERYERAIVRIHFPADALVLQAVFQPTEPVYALYKFTSQHVDAESVNNLILYTPPRRILSDSDMASTFASAGLLPAVNIYVSSRQKSSPVHVSSETQTKLKGPFQNARSVVSKWVTAACQDLDDVEMEASAATSLQAGNTSPSSEEPSIRPPKWFRIK